MAVTLEIACPNCLKAMKVPAEFAGKTIRCKGCSHTFVVAGPAAPTDAPRVAKARPVQAKPVAPVPPSAPPGDAPLKFQDDAPPPVAPGAGAKLPSRFDDDGDDDANPYGVTRDDSDVPRCPFCAMELDPPDTKVCLECGYNLLERKRHGSKKVYETTAGDYFMHWLPGIAWLIAMGTLFGLAIFSSLNMREWLTGSFLEKDEKNTITNAAEFYLPPFAFNICTWVVTLFILSIGIRYVIKRLVMNWRPVEVVKKT